MARVIDCVTFNGERELFDLRYNVLREHVDEFIVIEFDKTFSGENREINEENAMFFWQYEKVTHHIHTEELYEKYRDLAESSPNTVGAAHWKREFMQKESIKDALTHLDDDDLVFVGDVDEIWNPGLLIWPRAYPEKLRLCVYTYYLNNRSSEQFWGTLVSQYRYIREGCLNHLRTKEHSRSFDEPGWHFTSMGGPEALKKKLTDSYTQESYATPEVLESIAYNIDINRDFLGREFEYRLDESEWPEFLKINRAKYGHLCKQPKQEGNT